MANIPGKAFIVISGAYEGKYIVIPDNFAVCLNSPIEVIDTDVYKVNLPDINNFNTTGVVESIIELTDNYIPFADTQPYTKNGGLDATGNIFLAENTNVILMSDNISTGKVTAIFFGESAKNAYSKFKTFLLRAANVIYS